MVVYQREECDLGVISIKGNCCVHRSQGTRVKIVASSTTTRSMRRKKIYGKYVACASSDLATNTYTFNLPTGKSSKEVVSSIRKIFGYSRVIRIQLRHGNPDQVHTANEACAKNVVVQDPSKEKAFLL